MRQIGPLIASFLLGSSPLAQSANIHHHDKCWFAPAFLASSRPSAARTTRPRICHCPCRRRNEESIIKLSAKDAADTIEDDNNNGNDLPSPEDLSDAEVLLACRAYLMRHKKIKWSAHERRKKARDQSLAITEGESGAVGYFWENPDELSYLKTPGILDSSESSRVAYVQDESEEGGGGLLAVAWDGGDIWSDGVIDDDEEDHPVQDDGSGGSARSTNFASLYDSTYSSGPSDEHMRRSKAQSKKWTDPKWKEMWYKRRWGENGEKGVDSEEMMQRKLDDMVDAIPRKVLSSPELAAMSDEDIADAVRSYMQSRQKRSKARKEYIGEKNNVSRKEIETTQISEEDRLKAKQKERSERAKRAYETRRANEEKKKKQFNNPSDEKVKVIMPSQLPHVYAAQEAMKRIEWALYSGIKIDCADIDLLVIPGRMSGRKDALLRILNERFNLRGKCVPRGDGKFVFATNCSINKLAEFVKSKLREDNDEDKSEGFAR